MSTTVMALPELEHKDLAKIHDYDLVIYGLL